MSETLRTLTPKTIVQSLLSRPDELSDAKLSDILSRLTPEHLDENMVSEWLEALLETAPDVPKLSQHVIDCCGTGGSGLPHFNTSTITAFMLAAAGIPVVKFGNRGIQQAHGSFDFLGQLGFDQAITLENVPEFIEKSNVAFVFAPQCYPHLLPIHRVRKTLNTPTLFHYIGPLLNPFKPEYRVLGVSHPKMLPLLASVLKRQKNLQQAGVAHTSLQDNAIGLDELAPIGTNHLTMITLNSHQESMLPTGTALSHGEYQTLFQNMSVQRSHDIFKQMLSGQKPIASPTSIAEKQYNLCYQLIMLNTALGLTVTGRFDSMEDAVAFVPELFASEKVTRNIHRFQECYDASRK